MQRVQKIFVIAISLLVLLTMCSAPELLSLDQGAGELIAPPQAISSSGAFAPVVRGVPTPAAEFGGVLAPLPAAQQPRLPPVPPPAGALPEGPQSDLGWQIDGYLNDITSKSWFQGEVLVAREGAIILNKGYGVADHKSGAPNTPRTPVRLASLTKQFTAMAILILQAQGRLSVADPICAHLDPCPPAWQPLTIRHLLTHTGGLPNYTDFADFDERMGEPTTPEALIARFRDMPLSFAPGSAYRYGNSGYTLLATIVERASGQSFDAFLRASIFEPLGMANTGVDPNVGAISFGAATYTGAGVEAPFLDTSTLFGAGNLYSTAEDLYRWDQALYGEQLVPAALRDEAFSPGQGDYGYGWWITDHNGRRLISHQGNMSGVSTFIARYPDQQLTVIVLSNLQGANAAGIAIHIAELAQGHE
jgi:CubicO group peptidase (beta-lactamase class C family)